MIIKQTILNDAYEVVGSVEYDLDSKRHLIIMDDAFNVLQVDNYRLVGKCNRCGDCCNTPYRKIACEHLMFETVNGKPEAVCKIRHRLVQPVSCHIWPRDPTEELPERCTYRWVEVK